MDDARDEYTPDTDHNEAQPPENALFEQTASFKPYSTAAVVHLPGHPTGHIWVFDETWQGDKFMESSTPLQQAMVRAVLMQMLEALDDRRKEKSG